MPIYAKSKVLKNSKKYLFNILLTLEPGSMVNNYILHHFDLAYFFRHLEQL